MIELLALLIIAHAVGDFILQNEWMQTKSKSSFTCTVHVLCYLIPFAFLILFGLPVWAFILIGIQHWLQDRFALNLKWMKFYKQTPPEKWPAGPLLVDQSFHLAFIGLIYLFCAIKPTSL